MSMRRRAELLKVLPGDLAGTLAGAVHVVAADPYGEVGNTRQPDHGHYDSYRTWDGIAELRARLSSLTRLRPELRDAARRRFWERAAAFARAEGKDELGRLTAVLTETGKRRDNQAMLERELATIDDAATGTLRQAIGEHGRVQFPRFAVRVAESAREVGGQQRRTMCRRRHRAAREGRRVSR